MATALAATSVLLLASLAASSGATASAAGAAGAAGAAAGTRVGTAGTTKPPLLKPNLVALKAADLSIQRTEAGRNLRFESALGNTGRGPVEIRPNTNRPCPRGMHNSTQVIYRDVDGSGYYTRRIDAEVARRQAGCMLFHPQHDHWHFQAASRYTLYRPGEEQNILVAHRKMSFCLRDSRRLPASYGTFHQPQHYGQCSKWSPQGISTGWADVYQSYLAGQALPLPRTVRDGVYCLRIRVDPKDQLRESDDNDNTSVRAFELTGDAITYRAARLCQ